MIFTFLFLKNLAVDVVHAPKYRKFIDTLANRSIIYADIFLLFVLLDVIFIIFPLVPTFFQHLFFCLYTCYRAKLTSLLFS